MRKTQHLRATALALGLALGGGFASPRAFALSVPPDASVADIAAAMAAEGVETERLAGYAKTLLAQGVNPGNLTESLLRAGFATFDVVKGVLVETVVHSAATFKGDDLQVAADDLVREVAARVFYVQGTSVRPAVRLGVLKARQALLALGELPPGSDLIRYDRWDGELDHLLVRWGGEVDLLLQQAEAVAAAAGAWWQTDTAPGGFASAR